MNLVNIIPHVSFWIVIFTRKGPVMLSFSTFVKSFNKIFNSFEIYFSRRQKVGNQLYTTDKGTHLSFLH